MAGFKTNVMRILDQKKIVYTPHEYHSPDGTAPDGVTVASMIGKAPREVYKTLVTQGASRRYYVFVVPSDGQLDLKKAAKSVGEKSVELLHVKDINAVTGYVRGGCTPIGMKKLFRTVLHETASSFEKITFSGGRRGTQVELSPSELIKLINAETADIAVLDHPD